MTASESRVSRWHHRVDPGRSLLGVLGFRFVSLLTWTFNKVFYRPIYTGQANVPTTGPLIVVSNHQSFLDPAICNHVIAHKRHLVPLARSTLFKHPIFAKLIAFLNAIPLRQGEPDTAAIRAAIAQLSKGRAVLVYPEGARTFDGTLRPFQRGTWLLLRKANCPVLPIALEGAFDAWPRTRALPRLLGCRVAATVCEPIDHDTLLAMGEQEGMAHIARTIDNARLQLRQTLRERTNNTYPPPGPADHTSIKDKNTDTPNDA